MKTLLFRNTAWFLVLSFCLTQVAPAGFSAELVRPIDEGLRVSEKSAATVNPENLPTTVPSGAHEAFFSAGPLSRSTSTAEAVQQAVQDPITPRTPEEQAVWNASREDATATFLEQDFYRNRNVVGREEIEAAREILGSSVAYGVVQPSRVKDNTVTTNFYDHRGNLVGVHVVVLLEDRTDRWYEVDRNGRRAEVQPKLPSGVQAYVDALEDAGFLVKVTVVYLKCGSSTKCLESNRVYRFNIVDNKEYKQTPTSGLQSMSFQVNRIGVIVPGSIGVASYYTGNGITKVDGQIFYEALLWLQASQLQLAQSRLRTVPAKPTFEVGTLVDPGLLGDLNATFGSAAWNPTKIVRIDQLILVMTQIAVTAVVNGTIYFVKDGVDYKAYSIGSGKVIVEKALPPAVQAYLDAFQAALGNRYVVSASRVGGSFRFDINFRSGEDCSPICKVIFIPKPGQLTHMSFTLSASGRVDVSTLAVIFNVPGMAIDKEDALRGVVPATINAQLLYEALQQLWNAPRIFDRDLVWPDVSRDLPLKEDPAFIPDMTIDLPIVKIDRLLLAMTQVLVTEVDADEAIYFTQGGTEYVAYRDHDETVVLPKPVYEFSRQLAQELAGSGYAITDTVRQKDGTYLVSVVSLVKQALQGHLGNLSFVLSAEGNVLGISKVVYVGVENVEGQLLFEGLTIFARKNDLRTAVQVLVLMTKIAVTSVDESDAIHFTKEGVNYQVSPTGLYEEVEAPEDLVSQAQGILGVVVVSGVALVQVPMPEGAGRTTHFYDALGNFIGSYFTNPSLGSSNVPIWRDANGNVIS